MTLSRSQEEFIRNLVDEHTFTIPTLRDDLVDHLCCAVEQNMGSRGMTFEDALQAALHELAPKGLKSIEEETFFLINSSKTLSMKKVMYVVGLLSAISVCIGWTFKILHWRFGTELSVYGMMAFMLLFLPMLAINHYKFTLKRALSEKLKVVFGYSSGIVVGAAVVFKFLHLQGADLLLLAGAFMFSFGFLPFLFFNMYKKSLTQP